MQAVHPPATDIALITLDHPPVHSLSLALRQRIANALSAAQADPAIRAIVLTGSEQAFSAGADITEFGTPQQLQEPILRSLIDQIESSTKPVVAAIQGLALGGGLELALACHGRVAEASARVGLPEVTLGLIPGAGGTQRLPRLVGIDTAFALMAGGSPASASTLAESGLFDRVLRAEALDAAFGLATALAESSARGLALPRARDRAMNAEAVSAAVNAARASLSARQLLQPAYAALLDSLAACALPFEEGMKTERAHFLTLLDSRAAKALRHQFKAEKLATRPPASLQARPHSVDTVAVIGAGTMGSGIAIAALEAGLQVILLEQDAAALQRGRERIAAHWQQRLAAGKLSAEAAVQRDTALRATLDWSTLRHADVVIEAVFEDLAVKQAVFRQIDAHARLGAVLATNTSYLDIDAIAQVTSRPQDFIGLHFFSPAQVMKLLEVVRSRLSSPEALVTGLSLGKRLKKTPVLTGNAFGFIGNRVYNAYRRECEFMLEDGAWPEDIDDALTAFGMAMGPFAVADLSGLDIAWRMRQAQAARRDPRERYVGILDQLCEMGRLGRKSGQGYYTYPGGKQTRQTDTTVREVIEQASRQRGITRQPISPQDIVRRALLAMAREAALLLAEGVAARASDVDVVLVQGYGFPRWEGGPVFWAREQPRVDLEAGQRALVAASGHGFAPVDLSPLFQD